MSQMGTRPEVMWKTGSFWSFRNEAKVYGSPMFDSAWAAVNDQVTDPLVAVIAALRAAPVPFATVIPQSIVGNGVGVSSISIAPSEPSALSVEQTTSGVATKA